ncbi:hypothetical protein ACOI1H_24570, partial [Loktanella sp. DJP18]|uniref:hypothetical protein n=1 Tax=Loktanella sp. DJP18 TaxID=3409788 RepID=UPI003BB7E59A
LVRSRKEAPSITYVVKINGPQIEAYVRVPFLGATLNLEVAHRDAVGRGIHVINRAQHTPRMPKRRYARNMNFGEAWDHPLWYWCCLCYSTEKSGLSSDSDCIGGAKNLQIGEV